MEVVVETISNDHVCDERQSIGSTMLRSPSRSSQSTWSTSVDPPPYISISRLMPPPYELHQTPLPVPMFDIDDEFPPPAYSSSIAIHSDPATSPRIVCVHQSRATYHVVDSRYYQRVHVPLITTFAYETENYTFNRARIAVSTDGSSLMDNEGNTGESRRTNGSNPAALRRSKQTHLDRIVLSCLVLWFCNPLFGVAAFAFAMMSSRSSNPVSARRLGQLSLATSISGIAVAVVLVTFLAIYVSPDRQQLN